MSDSDSDGDLKELLTASKGKLISLVEEIRLIKSDTEGQKRFLEAAENEKSSMEKTTSDLREQLEEEQSKTKEVVDVGNEIKKTITKSKQDLAVTIEEGEHDEKELLIMIKKAQEEQKKIQAQYKELQKTNEKFDKEDRKSVV